MELNRAVAVGMANGPATGLELLDALVATGELSDYHLLYAVRGDLLARLGRDREAAVSFSRAAELTADTAEQRHLRDRAKACTHALAD